MKLFFSLIFFWSSLLNSREYFVITHFKEDETSQMVQRLLQEKYFIPADMIQIKSKKGCKPEHEVIAQVCVNTGERLTFPILRTDLLKKLRVLWKN